jgi:hypothetical protein
VVCFTKERRKTEKNSLHWLCSEAEFGWAPNKIRTGATFKLLEWGKNAFNHGCRPERAIKKYKKKKNS